MQEEPRAILSQLLGVAQSSAGSIVIYLSVCVCASEFSAVGRLDLSESRSTHALWAVQPAAWTVQGQSGEEDRGQRPLCLVAAGALLSLHSARKHCER